MNILLVLIDLDDKFRWTIEICLDRDDEKQEYETRDQIEANPKTLLTNYEKKSKAAKKVIIYYVLTNI